MSVLEIIAGDSVAAHQVHMLPSLAEDGLGLHLEEFVLVLEVNIWRDGGDAVADLDGRGNLCSGILRIINFSGPYAARLDAEDVHTGTCKKAVVGLHCEAHIAFRGAGVFDVVCGGTHRSL